MTDVIFVRHGESIMNKEKLFCGWTDSQLTDKGRNQAMEVAKKLKKEKMDLIISSDLKRCLDTARIINGNNNSNILLETGLRELNFGQWEGLSYEDIKIKYPKEAKGWEQDYIDFPIPKGESLRMMYTRANKAFEKLIRDNSGKNILIVSHAGIIRGILSKQICGNIEGYWKFKIINCGIVRMEFVDGFSVLKGINQ